MSERATRVRRRRLGDVVSLSIEARAGERAQLRSRSERGRLVRAPTLKNFMKKILLIFFALCLFSFEVSAQTNADSIIARIPADFKSDGCSLFPDGKYRDCCVAHDLAYFNGGSWTMRWRADKKLFKCVAAKKGFGHKILAPVIWLGVRLGGVHFLPTPFRWGFGRGKNFQTKQ